MIYQLKNVKKQYDYYFDKETRKINNEMCAKTGQVFKEIDLNEPDSAKKCEEKCKKKSEKKHVQKGNHYEINIIFNFFNKEVNLL